MDFFHIQHSIKIFEVIYIYFTFASKTLPSPQLNYLLNSQYSSFPHKIHHLNLPVILNISVVVIKPRKKVWMQFIHIITMQFYLKCELAVSS